MLGINVWPLSRALRSSLSTKVGIIFADHFKLQVGPKSNPSPGVPPSGAHTEEVIKIIKRDKVPLIIMEPYYSDSTPKLIAESTGAKLVKITQLCEGLPKTDSYIELMESAVSFH